MSRSYIARCAFALKQRLLVFFFSFGASPCVMNRNKVKMCCLVGNILTTTRWIVMKFATGIQ